MTDSSRRALNLSLTALAERLAAFISAFAAFSRNSTPRFSAPAFATAVADSRRVRSTSAVSF